MVTPRKRWIHINTNTSASILSLTCKKTKAREGSLISYKIMEKVILKNTEKHMEGKAVLSHSQHSLMRGKFFLSNLIFFHKRVTHKVDQRKPVDEIFLDFNKYPYGQGVQYSAV